MSNKLLAAAALAAVLVPGVANAGPVTRDGARPSVTEREPVVNPVTGFVTWLIVPGATGERSPAYADNPELIGSRRGSTDMAFRR